MDRNGRCLRLQLIQVYFLCSAYNGWVYSTALTHDEIFGKQTDKCPGNGKYNNCNFGIYKVSGACNPVRVSWDKL